MEKEQEFKYTIEPRVINGKTIMIKVYESSADKKIKQSEDKHFVFPKTKTGGKV